MAIGLADFLSNVATGYGEYRTADATRDAAQLQQQTAALNAQTLAQKDASNQQAKQWLIYGAIAAGIVVVIILAIKKLK